MSSAALSTQFAPLDIDAVRADFPALHQEISGQPLVYLDNSASTQKPHAVINAVSKFYSRDYANVHRGIHTLSQRATDHFEAARSKVRHFINAESDSEIIFTSGTTEAINLVAHSFARLSMKAGDEVLISQMEHHSNIVPWQLLEQQTGVKLRVIPINEHGEIIYSEFEKCLNSRTKLLSITQLSNALGTITPLKDMIIAAHDVGAKVLVDGAQATAHACVDVRDLNCDFYAFSGHKLFSPTGIGVLYGKHDLLDAMPPYQSGGEMIKVVSFSGTTYNELPHKFEAGTPNIAGAVGLGAGIDYIQSVGLQAIQQHEQEILSYGTDQLLSIDGLRIIGTAREKAGVLSFELVGAHASDLGTLLDSQGVAVRVGHHCAMPVMEFFGVEATTRASLALYNNKSDIDRLIAAIKKAATMLQ